MKPKIALCVGVLFILAHLLYTIASPIPVARVDAFPYRRELNEYQPLWLTHLANFDGAQYVVIARAGYQQYQQGFFPLYPAAMYALGQLFDNNFVVSGLAVSALTFVVGLLFFGLYASDLFKQQSKARWAVVMLLAFPTSFFYVTAYPESLFFMFAAMCLYFLSKRSFVLAGISAYCASLTKIQGVFLAIPFLFSAFRLDELLNRPVSISKLWLETRKHVLSVTKKHIGDALWGLAPFAGLATYSAYLFFRYGDALYYYHSQPAFGANRVSDHLILLPQVLYRYIKIFVTSDMNVQLGVAAFEFAIFIFCGGLLLYDVILLMKRPNTENRGRLLSLNLFSLTALLLPTLTGTLSSVPRYMLVSLGVFPALARIENKLVRWATLIIFIFFHIAAFELFQKGYFVS